LLLLGEDKLPLFLHETLVLFALTQFGFNLSRHSHRDLTLEDDVELVRLVSVAEDLAVLLEELVLESSGTVVQKLLVLLFALRTTDATASRAQQFVHEV